VRSFTFGVGGKAILPYRRAAPVASERLMGDRQMGALGRAAIPKKFSRAGSYETYLAA
jgi:hypothetical protein